MPRQGPRRPRTGRRMPQQAGGLKGGRRGARGLGLRGFRVQGLGSRV